MVLNAWLRRVWPVLCCFGLFGFCSALLAQDYASQQVPAQQGGGYVSPPNGSQPASRAPMEVAERTVPIPRIAQISLERRPDEHPLMPALRWANQGLQEMDQNLHDYSAVVVKRERIDGKLGEQQWMFIKIRHKPFSVYMHFLKPKSLKGREVIYVEGANDGKLLAHATGLQAALGTLPLHPTSPLAMKDQHYPITEMGVRNLVQRLLEVGTNDTRYGECEVTVRRDAKINDRSCTLIEVVHPQPRRNFLFHTAKIFVDNELNIPIRYESHDWPKEPGDSPELIEEYTYLNLKPNVGFSDVDFDIRNPDYNFKEGRR